MFVYLSRIQPIPVIMSLRRSGRTPVQRVTYTSSIVETKPKSGGVKKKASTRITKTNASDVKPRTSKTK